MLILLLFVSAALAAQEVTIRVTPAEGGDPVETTYRCAGQTSRGQLINPSRVAAVAQAQIAKASTACRSLSSTSRLTSTTGPESAPREKPYLYLDNCLRNARDHAQTRFRADGQEGSSTAGAYWPCTVTSASRPAAGNAPWFLNLVHNDVCKDTWRSQYAQAYRAEWDRYRAAMSSHCPSDGHVPSISERQSRPEPDLRAIEAAAEEKGPPVVTPAW